MLSRLEAILLAITLTIAHAVTLPARAVSISHTTSSKPGLASILESANPRDITSSSPNFLGVECYHLLPNTVNLQTCQPLFAKMVRHGDVYEKISLANGWWFETGSDPCFIKIFSPDRDDRYQRIVTSLADIMLYTTEILQTCTETGTGGANTFHGSWRVEVSRNKLKMAPAAGRRTRFDVERLIPCTIGRCRRRPVNAA